MKETFINDVVQGMIPFLDNAQLEELQYVLRQNLMGKSVVQEEPLDPIEQQMENQRLSELFIAAKRVEGCSEKSLKYYLVTITSTLQGIGKEIRHITTSTLQGIGKEIRHITTDDLRMYLTEYQARRNSSKVTIDNIRRILSSFFSWLEDEDYILKSPVRRIHKVKTTASIKEIYTDEELEVMRDNCEDLRDLAIIDMLASTGMRVGELVRLNREDINFTERECVVLGKGDKERPVYFDARTKLHLMAYLEERTDNNPALFVSLKAPYDRLQIGGVEVRIREMGQKLGIKKAHPHKFRRTLATTAIDKGMPIEQVQRLLGHQRIDTTMMYAQVKQSNVKIAHRKYVG